MELISQSVCLGVGESFHSLFMAPEGTLFNIPLVDFSFTDNPLTGKVSTAIKSVLITKTCSTKICIELYSV